MSSEPLPAQGPVDVNVSRLAEGQPGNNAIIAAFNEHMNHQNADTFAALVAIREARTTWYGTSELDLRKRVDALIRSPAAWMQPRPLSAIERDDMPPW